MSTFREPVDWPCETTWRDIKAAFERECPDGFYPMELFGTDQDIAQAVWNQGIDSRLEAITEPSAACWKNKGIGQRLSIKLDINGLLVFLRRLYEMDDEVAGSLYGGILSTLGLEEV